MTPTDRRQFLGQSAAIAAGCFVAPALAADPPKALVNGQPQAATTGNAVLAAGGNAVDAVVSAALVAGVVAVHSTGIGGYGGHMVIARPDGKVTAIDFNSTAPAAAKPDMFPVDEKGVVKDRVNTFGWLAAGVPGVLAGLQLALDKFGTKKFPELAKPAIRYARGGFPVVKGLATAINTHRERLAKDAGSAKLFFDRGELLGEGSTFRNPDLADLLQALADRGRVDDFYRGKIAEKIAAAFKKNGGLVTADDLAAYKAVEVTPSSIEWK
ncbi:MAG TPA: gamma-glutamyltransferase, partial [Gemmataceae bacterium]|nr:gamma-glutamyltransferase [Gemmataceae bacterium]